MNDKPTILENARGNGEVGQAVIDNVLGWEVVPNFGNIFRNGEAVPANLIGAEIIRIGTLDEPHRLEGGGLLIDYRPRGEQEARRLVIAFNDTAMWASTRTELAPSPIAASS